MWSGGKDSCLAVWRTARELRIDYLVSMLSDGRSRAHGLSCELLRRQADCVGIEIFLVETTWESYEERLKKVFEVLNARRAVFGDIYLEEHRRWIERVCSEVGVEPIFPLWREDTSKLAREFASMFEAYVVAAKRELAEILGRKFDFELIEELESMGVDPCGENGEFHTLVVDGPLFTKRLDVNFGGVTENERYLLLEVKF
ncbi:MAG: diphthine--ammonia ligase [Archaeoglobaceae archaeon]